MKNPKNLTLTLACCLLTATQAHAALRVYSETLQEGMAMPKAQQANIFGCDGGNQPPQIAWEGAPEGTRSFALSMYDPDAPTGSGFWHWMIINLPAQSRSLPADPAAYPEKAQKIKNDGGQAAYLGSCPPQGEKHRYQITLYALDSELDIPADASPALAGFFIHQHLLEKAQLTVYHQR